MGYNNPLGTIRCLHPTRREEAFNKLYQTMLENLYLVPFLLGRNPQSLDVWHGSNLEWIEYTVEIPHELVSLWDDAALH